MESYFTVAAKWWADCIRNPSIDNYYMGDDSVEGNFAMMAAFLKAQEHKPRPSDVEYFEHHLAEIIMRDVNSKARTFLMTSSEPKYQLREIAAIHHIDSSCFPLRTYMTITKNEVSVNHGFEKPHMVIYSKN